MVAGRKSRGKHFAAQPKASGSALACGKNCGAGEQVDRLFPALGNRVMSDSEEEAAPTKLRVGAAVSGVQASDMNAKSASLESDMLPFPVQAPPLALAAILQRISAKLNLRRRQEAKSAAMDLALGKVG